MPLEIATHRNHLLRALKDIYTDPLLGPRLGFKGGTAAYFFHDLDRFSVDLDFDLLDPEAGPEVFARLLDILGEYGRIKDSMDKEKTMLIVVAYDDRGQNLKVEVNKQDFGSRYELRRYLGISAQVIRQEDMFAHKLVALLERGQVVNRDIYDVHFFAKRHWPVNRTIVERRTGSGFADYLARCVQHLENLPAGSALAGLGELVDERQKAWVRNDLVSDTVFLLKLLLQNEESAPG